MPTRDRVQAFIDAVVGGDHVQALFDFYHEDASSQEPGREPRQGLEALVAAERAALARTRMHTHPVEDVLVDGDRVVIRWIFDMTDEQGVTRRLEELTLQHWRGDRIASERFFYDRGLAAKPLTS
jgi:ketosteroid isomerase-like protein